MRRANNSLKPWEITPADNAPPRTRGLRRGPWQDLRLTPREERRGPSAGGGAFGGRLNRLPDGRRVLQGPPSSAGQLPAITAASSMARGR